MKTLCKAITFVVVVLLIAGLVLGLVVLLRRNTSEEHNYEIFPTDTIAENGDGLFLAVCKDCGYQYEFVDHRYAEEWSFDKSFHWRDALCSHNVVSQKAAHVYKDGFCAVCGLPKDLPVSDELVTLFLKAHVGKVPEYASLYFAGGATSWGADDCTMTRIGDSDYYYIQLALDKEAVEYNAYKVAFGYNDKVSEESVRVGKTPGIQWDYAADECGSNLQFTWDEESLVYLGEFTFSKMLTDGDLPNWIVTGSFTDWATTTDNADYIFSKANNFTITLDLHEGDVFKFKYNVDDWEVSSIDVGLTGVNFSVGDNISVPEDCKVKITLHDSRGFEYFSVELVSE